MSILSANLLSLLILLVFVRNRWRRTRSWLEPGIIFAVNLLVLYPIRGMLILLLGEQAVPNYVGTADPENLAFCSWLATLGCLGFVLGYLAVVRRSPLAILSEGGRRIHRDDVAVCSAFFAVSLIGVAYRIATDDYMSYLISENRIQSLTQIGALLTLLQWPAFIGAWVLWFRGLRTPSFVALFTSLQLVVIPYQFLQGSKTFLSLLLVSVLMAFYWSRGRVPKVAAIGTVAVVVLFVFPFVQGFRDFVNVEYGTIPSLQTLDVRSLAVASATTKAAQSATALESLLAVSSRYGGIDELYSMTLTVPSQLPYRYGTDYAGVFINLVPRALWPDKPIISAGATYGASLGAITSITPFPFGDAYWDMGVLGLLVGMIVWGGCLGAMVRAYSYFYDKTGLSFFIGTYFLSQIYWIASSESSMAGVVSTIPQQVVILSCLYHGLRGLKRLKGVTYIPTTVVPSTPGAHQDRVVACRVSQKV